MFKFFSLSQNICLNNKPGFKTKCFTGSKKLNFIGNIKSPLLKPNLKTRTKLKKTLLYKIYFSNCTFPYNYLVTTSSQSVSYPHELLILQQIRNPNHFSRFQQITSQTVTGGLYRAPVPIHRNFSDLRLLAIPPSYLQVAENNPF